MRIVSFGMMLPDEQMGNAGGQFYARHVRALQQLGHDVLVVAPAGLHRTTPPPDWYRSVGVTVSYRFDRSPFRALNRIFIGGVRPAYRRAVRANRIVRREVRSADLIEYQWCEFGTLARTVERIRATPGPSHLVVHDELLQREARAAVAAAGWRRLVLRAGVHLVRLRERAAFRRISRLLTISLKDANACREIWPGSDVDIVAPPVAVDRASPELGEQERVLFVGAMGRRENEVGVLWFLGRVWPSVRAELPNAEFVIAGSHPSDRILASADGSVTVTGFVADIESEYRRARVVIVPLHTGAGVKFKTIEALAHGLPVVTTAVGCEGIFEEHPDVFAAITDDPDQFASAVIAALKSPASAGIRASIAARTAAEYGIASYPERLESFLRHVPFDRTRA